jgi:hypothetical protein
VADRRRRRILALRQAIDPVVEQNDLQIHVAADAMQQMIAADAQSIAVSRNDPHLQVGPAALQSRGERRRPAMDAVHAVGVHVIGKATRAADARNEHDVLTRNAERRHHLLHLRKNRIVAATRAPAHILVAREILRRELR